MSQSVQKDYFSDNSESLRPKNRHLHLENTLNIWTTPSLVMRHAVNIMGTGFIGKKRRVVRRREKSWKKTCCRAHTSTEGKSMSGRGSQPRSRWSRFNSQCPGMTLPKFELEPRDKLWSARMVPVNH